MTGLALIAGGLALSLCLFALVVGSLLVHWLAGPEEWPDTPARRDPRDGL